MFETPHRLHPAAIVINFGVYFVATVRSLAAPLIGIFITGRDSSANFMSIMIGGGIAVIGGISLIGPILNYFSTTFFIEGDSLVISSGFIWRKRRTIPLARIQNVNIERTIWHRLLKSAKVKVETAAGAKSEGDLTALSVDDANKLQAVLLQRKQTTDSDEPETKSEPLYQLSPKQVILAGALGNRAIYIFGSIFAVFQAEGAHRFFKPILNYIERLGPATSILAGAGIFVGLVILGWLLSIGISATRYYGFRIEKHERGILITHGLITQFKSVVPVGRIQDVRIVEPILFRLLGYCEVYADTAGSFDKKDVASANKICPILPEREASRIGKLLMPEFEFETLKWQQVSKKTIVRHAARHFFSYLVVIFIPLAIWLKWYSLIFIAPIAIYSWITGLVSYHYVGYSWTNDILAARRGVFRKQATIIPFDRIQHYTINSSYFQRRLGLATVTAVSASTGGHSIHVADVDMDSVDGLRETIAVSIQSHLGSRKGGI